MKRVRHCFVRNDRARGLRIRGVLLAFAIANIGAVVASEEAPGQGLTLLTTPVDIGDSDKVDYQWRIRPLGEDPISLEKFRGRVLFINAWASWCTPCIREMASIERLHERLVDTDIVFLLVAVEGERPVRRHLRISPISVPIYLEDERFPQAFGLRGIPMSWIVDREGRIVFRHYGAADWDHGEVETFLRQLDRPDDKSQNRHARPGGF